MYLGIIIIFVYHIFPCNYLITQRLPWQAENRLVRHYRSSPRNRSINCEDIITSSSPWGAILFSLLRDTAPDCNYRIKLHRYRPPGVSFQPEGSLIELTPVHIHAVAPGYGAQEQSSLSKHTHVHSGPLSTVVICVLLLRLLHAWVRSPEDANT